jgi:hypothetical protein
MFPQLPFIYHDDISAVAFAAGVSLTLQPLLHDFCPSPFLSPLSCYFQDIEQVLDCLKSTYMSWKWEMPSQAHTLSLFFSFVSLLSSWLLSQCYLVAPELCWLGTFLKEPCHRKKGSSLWSWNYPRNEFSFLPLCLASGSLLSSLGESAECSKSPVNSTLVIFMFVVPYA